MPYGNINLKVVNIGSGNGLVPDAQAITSNNVDVSSNIFCSIRLRTISQKILMKLIHNICSEITF